MVRNIRSARHHERRRPVWLGPARHRMDCRLKLSGKRDRDMSRRKVPKSRKIVTISLCIRPYQVRWLKTWAGSPQDGLRALLRQAMEKSKASTCLEPDWDG